MNDFVPGVYRLSLLYYLGGGTGIELITHPGRSSMNLCGQKSMFVIQNLSPSPTGRGSIRPGWRGSRKRTYTGEVNLR